MIESSILVSVIIPCYNAQRFAEEAIRSIMEQSYKNLEILICNDCSIDESPNILQKLSEEDKRIKVFRNEKNLGIVKTLNFLVEKAQGKYIARMDADDISLSTRIERQVDFLEKNKEIAVCGTRAFHINENDKKIGKSPSPIKSDDVSFFSKYFCPLYHPSVMARAEVLKNNLYDEKFKDAEDYELWLRLIFKKGMKLTNLDERLLLYRISNNQVSKKHSEQQIISATNAVEESQAISKEYIDIHKNIFFLHEKAFYSKTEVSYAITQLKYLNSIEKKNREREREREFVLL